MKKKEFNIYNFGLHCVLGRRQEKKNKRQYIFLKKKNCKKNNLSGQHNTDTELALTLHVIQITTDEERETRSHLFF